MAAVIDAHHHYWRTADQGHRWRTADHDAIARDYLPADLAPELSRAGVERTVLVQAADLPEENDRLADYARVTSTVAGVVGWLPLSDPEAAMAELDRADTRRWSGVRCQVGRDSLRWLSEPATVAVVEELAARGLSWDVVPVTPDQVKDVLRLIEQVPDLRVVVDHLCRPPVDVAGWQPWADQVHRLAQSPSVALKLSVGVDLLTAVKRWPGDRLGRYVGWALEQFGPQRLMMASNWPVVLLRADYATAWGDLVATVREQGLGDAAVSDVLGGTAAQWYGLDQSR